MCMWCFEWLTSFSAVCVVPSLGVPQLRIPMISDNGQKCPRFEFPNPADCSALQKGGVTRGNAVVFVSKIQINWLWCGQLWSFSLLFLTGLNHWNYDMSNLPKNKLLLNVSRLRKQKSKRIGNHVYCVMTCQHWHISETSFLFQLEAHWKHTGMLKNWTSYNRKSSSWEPHNGGEQKSNKIKTRKAWNYGMLMFQMGTSL